MITTAQIKGPRSTQEDRFVVATVSEGALLAVMDGHGGAEVADYVARHLKAAWETIRPEYDVAPKMRQVVTALHMMTNEYHAGSTLSLVFIPTHEKVAYVAVLGDSPVIVSQPNGTLHISPDHNVRTNSDEARAAMSRGAVIVGGYMHAGVLHTEPYHFGCGPGLQMTRALGDVELDSVLDRNPDVYSVPLGEFVLVASDGLFDPAHSADPKRQAYDFAIMVGVGATAEDLVHSVKQPKDNVTAILWKRRPRPRINVSTSNVFGIARPNSEPATT